MNGDPYEDATVNLIDIAEQAITDFYGGVAEEDRDLASAIIGAIAIPFREMVRSELQAMADAEVIEWVRVK